MLANIDDGKPLAPPCIELAPFAASNAALYDEAGAKFGIDCDRKGELESGPNDGGELIDEPNEALNGECELAPACGPTPDWPPWGCCCWPAPASAPLSEPNGKLGEMEKVEPPSVNEGAPADWPEKRPCCWLAPNDSNGDCGATCCCCDGCCCCCCCDCGGLKRL